MVFFIFTLLSCFTIFAVNAEDYSSTYYYNQQYQNYNSQREERLKVSHMYTAENGKNQCTVTQGQTSCSAKLLNEEQSPSYTPVVHNKNCGNPRCFFIAITGGVSHTIDHDATPAIQQKTNNDPFYGMIIGANATDKFKIGLEGLRTVKHVNSATMGNFSLRSTTIIPNFYIMMPYSTFRPYLLFGVGLAYNKLINNSSSYTTNSDDTTLAYQVGAGVNFNYDKIFINTEVKYLDRGTAKAVSKSNASNIQKVKLKDILLGIAMGYNF